MYEVGVGVGGGIPRYIVESDNSKTLVQATIILYSPINDLDKMETESRWCQSDYCA